MTDNVALVVAGGRGRRFGDPVPKQYQDLAGRPLLRHTVRALLSHPRVTGVRVVIHPDDRDRYETAVAGLDLLEPVTGGASRQDSVRRGLESLAARAPHHVLIHDAARPFVSAAVVSAALDALADVPAALPALAVADTLKRGADGRVLETVERAGLYRAQTPQCFRFADILTAHRAHAGEELTDDAAVAERAGLPVALVPGDEENVKVTTRDDLERARARLAAGAETRIGIGHDVHRLVAGDGVTLCGVRVPFDRTLEGHSDADVGLHALTDALLGAIAAGDIGGHFPPSDPRWRGAASGVFVRHAAELVHARGGRIVNADVTLVCEAPKIGPYRTEMAEAVAEMLDLPADRVSVKATTTEALGAIGRGEGIAAHAVVSVALPGAE